MSFHSEFGLSHMKTQEHTFSSKRLFTGGKLAAQTLPPLYLETAQETIDRTGETPEKDRAAKTSVFHKLGWKPKSLANKEGCDAMKATNHYGHEEPSAKQKGSTDSGKVCQDHGRERYSSRTKDFKEGPERERWCGEGRAGSSRARETAKGRTARLRLRLRQERSQLPSPGTPPSAAPPSRRRRLEPRTPGSPSGPGCLALPQRPPETVPFPEHGRGAGLARGSPRTPLPPVTPAGPLLRSRGGGHGRDPRPEQPRAGRAPSLRPSLSLAAPPGRGEEGRGGRAPAATC